MSYKPTSDDVVTCCLDTSQDHICSSLRAEFESRLLASLGGQAVHFPDGLLSIMANHVLQEASQEPYGLKGGRLHIQYEGHTALHYLATLDCDPDTPAKTFELTLTLREAQASWPQRMARRLSQSSPIEVSTTYKLVKRRTYRNDQ